MNSIVKTLAMTCLNISLSLAANTSFAGLDEGVTAIRLDQIEYNQRQILDNQRQLDRRLPNETIRLALAAQAITSGLTPYWA